ncbi:MAG TPA: peptidase M15, partial [Pseudorhodoplanes sp.]|nr:peptidase M15 [Pseudorhodoplanes sp.]
PVKAEPPNLRDDMCGKKRKRPAAESEDEDDDDALPGQQVDAASPQSINLANLRGSISKPSTLIGGLTPSMEPIVVFTGATRPGTNVATISEKPAAKKKEKKDTTTAAAKPVTTTAAKPAEAAKPQVSAPAFAATPPNYPSTNAFTPGPAAAKPAANAAAKPADKPADKKQDAKAKPAATQASAAAKPAAKPTAQ